MSLGLQSIFSRLIVYFIRYYVVLYHNLLYATPEEGETWLVLIKVYQRIKGNQYECTILFLRFSFGLQCNKSTM